MDKFLDYREDVPDYIDLWYALDDDVDEYRKLSKRFKQAVKKQELSYKDLYWIIRNECPFVEYIAGGICPDYDPDVASQTDLFEWYTFKLMGEDQVYKILVRSAWFNEGYPFQPYKAKEKRYIVAGWEEEN